MNTYKNKTTENNTKRPFWYLWGNFEPTTTGTCNTKIMIFWWQQGGNCDWKQYITKTNKQEPVLDTKLRWSLVKIQWGHNGRTPRYRYLRTLILSGPMRFVNETMDVTNISGTHAQSWPTCHTLRLYRYFVFVDNYEQSCLLNVLGIGIKTSTHAHLIFWSLQLKSHY